MTILILLALAILVLGPGRRVFFRQARFTVPAALGLVAGLVFGDILMAKAGVGFPFSVAIPLALGLGLGVCAGMRVKAWCDETFGPKGDRRHDEL